MVDTMDVCGGGEPRTHTQCVPRREDGAGRPAALSRPAPAPPLQLDDKRLRTAAPGSDSERISSSAVRLLTSRIRDAASPQVSPRHSTPTC